MGCFVSCDHSLGLREDVISNSSCIEKERQALLSFKADLVDINNNLYNWGSQRDCCDWVDVNCNYITGHVIGLDLSTSSNGMTGKISPSLQGLHHLEYLGLRGIDFQFNPIPTFLGSLVNLNGLDISSVDLFLINLQISPT
ncbi:hypothetical protein L6452_12173 [Arctium lappa]|uniref:Uncharacterized protein n=1 Tax=Arctium lappa TaxID=4217 RepID=A0ACB9DQH9_ARCLA|nr:hypothetical protein L6452_12173 [Arctium lappa]